MDALDEILAELGAEEAARARFVAHVVAVFTAARVVREPANFPGGAHMILHVSTGEPGRFQISQIDDRGPWGHTTRSTVEDAAVRMWDDLEPARKEEFRPNASAV